MRFFIIVKIKSLKIILKDCFIYSNINQPRKNCLKVFLVFFYRYWRFQDSSNTEGTIFNPLYNFHPFTEIPAFISIQHLKWLARIFLSWIACNYLMCIYNVFTYVYIYYIYIYIYIYIYYICIYIHIYSKNPFFIGHLWWLPLDLYTSRYKHLIEC